MASSPSTHPTAQVDLGPLGPPPPYKPIQATPKPRPHPVQMAAPPPAPAMAAAVNMRAVGELGPPPPYRPIVQAGAAFERGPPPDLEPWRVESLNRPHPIVPRPHNARGPERAQIDLYPDLPEWSVRREPPPGLRIGPDAELWDEPAGYPAGYLVPPPVGLPAQPGLIARWIRPSGALPPLPAAPPAERAPPRRRRVITILAIVVLLGGGGTAGLYFGRWKIMRAVPETQALYDALGLRSGSPAAKPAADPQ